MKEASRTDHRNKKGEAETPRFFRPPPPDPAPQPGRALARLPVAGIHLRSGDLCPQCQTGRLDYDGLLNLSCAGCGFSPGGGCFS